MQTRIKRCSFTPPMPFPRPFNGEARPSINEEAHREYAAYCELASTPQESGPSEVRAAEYRRIYDALVATGNYPTYDEMYAQQA